MAVALYFPPRPPSYASLTNPQRILSVLGRKRHAATLLLTLALAARTQPPISTLLKLMEVPKSCFRCTLTLKEARTLVVPCPFLDCSLLVDEKLGPRPTGTSILWSKCLNAASFSTTYVVSMPTSSPWLSMTLTNGPNNRSLTAFQTALWLINADMLNE